MGIKTHSNSHFRFLSLLGVICGMICREYSFLVSDKDTLAYSITSEFSREKEELRFGGGGWEVTETLR